MAFERSGVASAIRRLIVGGAVRPPGDKSITHRLLVLGALARGRSRLEGALTAEDARSCARVLRQLGAEIGPLRGRGNVSLRGAPWRRAARPLHCGNSGTAARLLCGALAAHAFDALITGDRSLRRRPMRRVIDPLTRMGATFEGDGDHLPLTVRGGALRSIRYESPVASAQVKSALLLAGLLGGVDVTVHEPAMSRDHTERILQFLGFDVQTADTTVSLKASTVRLADLPAFALVVPGDVSSAAFLVATALLADEADLVVEGVGVNPTRIGFLRVVRRMGGPVQVANERVVGNEPVADLRVRPALLRATEVRATEIPSLVDEIPILAVLASRAEGETVFREVGELRVKESNRLELLAENLRAIGTAAEAQGQDLVVVGGSAPPRGHVETADDHRLAMAFAVLGLLPGAHVTLSEQRSPAVSYPAFFADIDQIMRS